MNEPLQAVRAQIVDENGVVLVYTPLTYLPKGDSIEFTIKWPAIISKEKL